MVLRALALSVCLGGASLVASAPAKPAQAAMPSTTPLAVVEQFHAAMRRGNAVAVAASMAGLVEVAAIDPAASMRSIDNAALKTQASIVRERLRAALERLQRSPKTE